MSDKTDRWLARMRELAEREEQGTRAIAACGGVTFTGDPAGIVKKMAYTLQEITNLYAQLRAMSNREMNSPTIMTAHAILSQVHIEPPAAEDI